MGLSVTLCDIKVIMGIPVMQSKSPCDIQVPPSDLLLDIGKFLVDEKTAKVMFKVKDEVFQRTCPFSP